MRCRKAKKLIYLLLENDLEQKEMGDLSDHLRSCRECSSEWGEAQRLHIFWKNALRQETLPQLSEHELPQRVEMRIEQLKAGVKEKTRKPKVFSFVAVHKRLVYGAAAVVLVFLSLWLGLFSKSEKKVPKDVVVHSAFVDEKKADFSILESKDKNIVFIWLEPSGKGG